MHGDLVERLRGPLFGVTTADEWPSNECVLHYRESSPPSYLLRIVLEALHGGRLPLGCDKSEWEVSLLFKQDHWVVADHRRVTWKLYGPADRVADAAVLWKKLLAAARLADSYVKGQCAELRREDNFFLRNEYPYLRGLYDHFRGRTLAALNHQEEREAQAVKMRDALPQKERISNTFVKSAWEASRTERHNAEMSVTACSVFFFAVTEAILDASFALGPRQGKSYSEFDALDWAERMKFHLEPSQPPLRDHWEKLLEARREMRNAAVHHDPIALFAIPSCGLVPATYTTLELPRAFRPFPSLAVEEVRRALSLFDSVLGILEQADGTRLGMMLAASGLAIPIAESGVSELRANMASPQQFQDELSRRIELECAYINMEI